MSGIDMVYDFNIRAGKAKPIKSVPVLVTAAGDQCGRILEELKETIESLEKMSLTGVHDEEFLDGVCDILVTSHGLAQIAKCAGYDVDGAMVAVGENNLSKVTTHIAIAEKTAEWYSQSSGEEFEVVEVVDYEATEYTSYPITYYSVHRVSDDKIMKLMGHVSPDLSKSMPEADNV